MNELSPHDQELRQIRARLWRCEIEKERLVDERETPTQSRSEVQRLTRQLQQARDEITAMRGTRGWRILEAWWGFKNRLRPARPASPAINPAPSDIRPASIARDPAYLAHIQETEPAKSVLERQARYCSHWDGRPLLSIITAAQNERALRQSVASIRAQTYDHWEWVIAVNNQNAGLLAAVGDLIKQESRIRLVRLDDQNIAVGLNLALEQAAGDYVTLVNTGDTLATHALYQAALFIDQHPEVDLIYADHDQIDEAGQREKPFFKPDWSPELLLSHPYLNGLSLFRRTLPDGNFDPALEGAHEWDFFLRLTRQTEAIYHIPEILYHQREQTAPPSDHSSEAIVQHLKNLGLIDPQVRFDDAQPDNPSVTWKIPEPQRISIIIPSRDRADVLRPCLESIFKLTTYPDFEVVVVDTGSTHPETKALYEQYHDRISVVPYDQFFNFSAACNWGARHASGERLLFLNNDTEVLQADWLERMAQWFEIEGVGIVGPKLLYPNGRIQHGGVIVGWNGTAAHFLIGENENISTMMGSDNWYRNFLSVSGACLMISRPVFESVGGFDEQYALLYSDTELGLRVNEVGCRVVYTPHVRLLHRESASRDNRAIVRSDLERASFRWRRWLLSGDPYFNPNLSYGSAAPAFRQGTPSPDMLNQNLLARVPDRGHFIIPDDLL